ncbi:MAG: T9SS type A sorting domain-containing protein [Flavobacteriales bacterium]
MTSSFSRIVSGVLVVCNCAPLDAQYVDPQWGAAFQSTIPGHTFGVRHLATHPNGNTFCSGRFEEGSLDIDPSTGSLYLAEPGPDGLDQFLIMLDATGALVWADSSERMDDYGNSSSSAPGLALAATSDGGAVAHGRYRDTVLYFMNDSTLPLMSTAPFVRRYDGTGALLWSFFLPLVTSEKGLIGTDSADNVYMLMSYTHLAVQDIDPGPDTVFLPEPDDKDLVLMKFSAQGDIEWARAFTSEGESHFHAFSVDKQGNSWFIGNTEDTLDLDPGPGQLLATSVTGVEEQFMVKFDANGVLVHGTVFDEPGTPPYATALSMAVLSDGGVVVNGELQTDLDMDPSTSTWMLYYSGEAGVYLQRFDANGQFVWAGAIQGVSGAVIGDDVAAGDGVFALCGHHSSATDLDPGPGVFTVTVTPPPGTNWDAFLGIYLNDGTFIAGQRARGISEQSFYRLGFVDDSTLMVGGHFNNEFFFGSNLQILGSGSSSGEGVLCRVGFAPSSLDVADMQLAATWSLYPNPAHDQLTVQGAALDAMVVVRSIDGRLLKAQRVSTTQVTLDIGDLSSGLYTISVAEAPGVQSVMRFVKD